MEANELSTALLCCKRFEGKHTGNNIKNHTEEVLREFELVDKVKFVISDNASNMVKAFSVGFSPSKEAMVDEEEIWCDVEDEAGNEVTADKILDEHDIQVGHLRCFAHSLQLTVKAGLNELRCHTLMAKCSRLTSLLHTSVNYQEVFEEQFGRQGLLQPVPTRWNSVFQHIMSFLKKDYEIINAVCSETNVNIRFTAKDWEQLREIEELLRPFYAATIKTQGDKEVTISYVIPCILTLMSHLEAFSKRSLLRVKMELIRDLECRFSGVFGFFSGTPNYNKLPCGQDVYFLATLLDPNFGPQFFHWYLGKTMKLHLLDELKETLLKNLDGMEGEPDSPYEPTLMPSQDLFSEFENSFTSTQSVGGIEAEMGSYFTERRSREDAFQWWKGKEEQYPKVSKLAKQCLCVPATSAPVERVFSHGGLITRPHRATMSPSLVEELVFLKCNRP